MLHPNKLINVLPCLLKEVAKPGYDFRVHHLAGSDAIEIQILHPGGKSYQIVHYSYEHLLNFKSYQSLFDNLIDDLSMTTQCLYTVPKYWKLFNNHMRQILNAEVKPGSLWA